MRRSLLAILLVVSVVPALSGPASARQHSVHHHYRFARQHVQPVRAENFAPGLYAYAPDTYARDTYAPVFATRETNLRRSSARQSEWRQNDWGQSGFGPKQLESKQLQSIRAARRHGGGAGERQRRAGVAGRACHQARERRQSARGQPRQLRADADQARHRARHGIFRLGGGAARSAGQHDLRGALSRRRLSRRRRQRKPRRRALCQRLLLPGQGAGLFAVCGRGVVRLWRYRRVRSRPTRRSATTRRSIARGIIGITRCSAIFTSPRVRGEVEERSDEGEGASPRF